MTKIKLAVCEAPPVLIAGNDGWTNLIRAVSGCAPDILLLNEMPFGSWVSVHGKRDPEQLALIQQLHRDGIERLGDLQVPAVLGSAAEADGERSVNQAFVWKADSGSTAVHTKQYFPNEEGFYEARWFERGDLKFQVADANGLKVGFLLCTDVMFNEWARYYGRNGAHLIAVPRATPVGSVDRWRTMCSAAAIVSGCYVASSNRAGLDESGVEFAGKGWIIDPRGDVVAETSPECPVVTAEVDLSLVETSQSEYPCYVEELPQ